jgi:hypothetical protein
MFCGCRFTGSAGTAVVTTDKALLWTDGRYFLQAATELGPEWTLMKGGTGECPEVGVTRGHSGVGNWLHEWSAQEGCMG